MSSRFDPEYYSLYRPHYPRSTFEGILEFFKGHPTPLTIVDLGCGTGHSTRSILQLGLDAKIIGIDPDSNMIQTAKQTTSDLVTWIVASGEATPLSDQSVDLLLIGSAFHWMDRKKAAIEFKRILKPNGLLRIFEYQFPKAVNNPHLNEWIRREFNLNWKAPHQKPRGTLKEMTAALIEFAHFKFHREAQPEMRAELSEDELLGQILSQSRVLHYLDSLPHSEKEPFKRTLQNKIQESLKPNEVFDFKLSWIEFKNQ